MEVTVIDSIMGSGKTSWAIDFMNKTDMKVIYVTPYLNEITRIKKAVKSKRFYEPENYGEGKEVSLKQLLETECNIATTHALFTSLDKTTLELLKAKGYTLILDEVIEVVVPIPVRKGDVKLLKDAGAIYEDEKGRVHFVDNYIHKDGTFDSILEKIKTNHVICVNGNYFMWVMPVEVFQNFKSIYIMTYLFNSQILKNYFELYELNYEVKSVELIKKCFTLIPYKDDRTNIKNLINICEDEKLNDIGFSFYSLSKSWYLRANRTTLRQFKNNIRNFARNKMNAKTGDILWTTFKGSEEDTNDVFIEGKSKNFIELLKGDGYRSEECFAPCNARATNEYKDRTVVIYTVNRFINPNIELFFKERGIAVDSEGFALSSLLQWLYRSAIRDGKEINLYIPSRRMRTLLTNWINDN